jgi:hypothetical protein
VKKAGVLAGKFVSVAPDFKVIVDALLSPMVTVFCPLGESMVCTSILLIILQMYSLKVLLMYLI